MSNYDKLILPTGSEIRKFRDRLIKWSKENIRSFPWRKTGISNYKKIIAEVFLQRTKAETVTKFIPRFYKNYPSWRKLSSATELELREFITPVGLVNSRVETLKNLSREMVKRGGRVPCDRKEINKLPGVGQYIGNSIELLCCGKPLPLIDVNMARLLERYFGPRKLADLRYDPYLQNLANIIVKCEDPIRVNFAIIDFAHLVCTSRRPKCSDCVLSNKCRYFNHLDS